MIESLKKNKKGIVLMCISSIFVCVGQLFWKLSVGQTMFFLIPGFILYEAGALFMLYAYRFGSLSVLQPVLSLNYVFSILLSYFVLHEEIRLQKCVGVLLIILGVTTIAMGDGK